MTVLVAIMAFVFGFILGGATVLREWKKNLGKGLVPKLDAADSLSWEKGRE